MLVDVHRVIFGQNHPAADSNCSHNQETKGFCGWNSTLFLRPMDKKPCKHLRTGQDTLEINNNRDKVLQRRDIWFWHSQKVQDVGTHD